MMVVIALQDGQLTMMPEGFESEQQIAELCESAGKAIRAKIAAEAGPPKPQLYLPNGHGPGGIVPPPPGGMQ
jgi:hypothetical protein